MKVFSMKFANIIIATVLIASPFVVGITTSQYDPWADINEDGKIDIYDVAYTARAFGTSGDPAKNVTIAGYANIMDTRSIDIPEGGYHTEYINTRGYRKITIGLSSARTLDTDVLWEVNGIQYLWETLSHNGRAMKVYEINGDTLRLYTHNPNVGSEHLWVDYYITA